VTIYKAAATSETNLQSAATTDYAVYVKSSALAEMAARSCITRGVLHNGVALCAV